jgi:hypothetical protein
VVISVTVAAPPAESSAPRFRLAVAGRSAGSTLVGTNWQGAVAMVWYG